MVTYRAYDEIIDFIASSPDPKDVLNFRPPSTVIKRVEDLLYKKKTAELSNDENTELDRFMLIEHIMIMAKKRLRKFKVLKMNEIDRIIERNE